MDSLGYISSLATAITVPLGVGVIILFYYYNKQVFSYWQKRRISGPSPWPLCGTLAKELLGDRQKLMKMWRQKYGKIYGTYHGTKPSLVVADAELMQQIAIKDFDIFPNHDDGGHFTTHYQKLFLFFLKDDHWRRVRALMSPTFTSGKIKRMFKFLDACADDLVRCFDEQLVDQVDKMTGKKERKAIVHVKDTYNLYTMDGISTCCFGLKLERSGSKDLKTGSSRNDFVKLVMKVFTFEPLRLAAYLLVPETILKMFGFKINNPKNFVGVTDQMRQLIDIRRKSSKKYDDYLELLLNAKLDDGLEIDDLDKEENHHAGLTKESIEADQRKLVENVNNNLSRHILAEEEIVVNAMFLLAAGVETTSTLLTDCTYLLAFNPDIQQRLYEEVSKIAEYKENDKNKTLFTYESITSCHYLDSVISESLRIFCPVYQIEHIASEEYRIEKYQLVVEKGTKVVLAYYTIMNDPEYWPEPDKFDPERFMPANKDKIVPGSYCPFGVGPRHCIGMRFSLTEAKLALAKVIMKYRFEPAPGTQWPPVFAANMNFANIKRPLVTFVARG